MEHRHNQHGLVPFTAAISTDAAAILSSLSHALGSGNDLSPVIEKLALSILPEWRQLQFEKHAHQKQIDDLQGKIAVMEQDLTAATVAALATPTNATRMSDELLSTGAPDAAAQPDAALSSLSFYQGKRFLKSIHDLDPSARRKRRAKFVKCLTELSDTYGIDMSYLSTIVAELKEAPTASNGGHARVNSAPSPAAHTHAYYAGHGSHGVQQHPAFIMPSHLSSAGPSSSTSPAMGAYTGEGGQMRLAPALALAPGAATTGAVVGFAPMAPQTRTTEDDVTMAPVSKSMESETARPSVLDMATVVHSLSHEGRHKLGGAESEDARSGSPPSTTSTSTSARSLESAGRPTVKGGGAQ